VPDLIDRNHSPAPTLARRGALFLCAIWLLAGVVGHDPWKVDDVLHLGVAYGMAGGDWLVPRIAGDPCLVSPPLYHWVAALCGKLLGWLLPWHDAARLASVLFGAAFLAILSRMAKQLLGASAALAAPLLAIGTLGLLVPLHEAQPAIVAITVSSFPCGAYPPGDRSRCGAACSSAQGSASAFSEPASTAS
jgi:4-amino-4-deoxy-L-arabinose transferase-like glycosyltransferase